MEKEVAADTPVAENNSAENAPLDIQAMIDTSIAKAKSQWEAEAKKTKEAERLSKLSEEERRKAELENTRQELETQRSEFEREKIKYEATRVLAQRNLPVDFVEYLVDGDNEKTLARITTFEKKYKKAIEDGINERLKGKAPVSGGNKTAQVSSTAAFMKAIYDSQINV